VAIQTYYSFNQTSKKSFDFYNALVVDYIKGTERAPKGHRKGTEKKFTFFYKSASFLFLQKERGRMTFNPIGVIGNMSKKAITLLIALSVVSISALSIGIAQLFNSSNQKIAPIDAETYLSFDSFLYRDNFPTNNGGKVNGDIYNKLTALAAAAKPVTTVTTNGSTFYFATARDIAAANGTTDAPVVKLFQTALPSSSSVPASKLSEQYFRVVAITYPLVGNPVFTFMSTGAYRNEVFNAGTGVGSDLWANSIIPNTLKTDFETNLLPSYPAYVKTAIQTPQIWQTSNTADGAPQPNTPWTWGTTYTAKNQNITQSRQSDLIWLPSDFETGDRTNDPGNWGLNATERVFLQNGFDTYSFSRSGISYSVNGTVCCGTSSGNVGGNMGGIWTNSNRSIVPAVHMDISIFAPHTTTTTITNANPLFSIDEYNENLVTELETLAAAAKPATTMTANGETFHFATARDIAAANGTTDAPNVKLFQNISSSTANANKLSEQFYRIVAITYPAVGDPIYTFYSTGAYANNVWWRGQYLQNYNTDSVIPDVLRTDFENKIGRASCRERVC
jgi:hypothetical protein